MLSTQNRRVTCLVVGNEPLVFNAHATQSRRCCFGFGPTPVQHYKSYSRYVTFSTRHIPKATYTTGYPHIILYLLQRLSYSEHSQNLGQQRRLQSSSLDGRSGGSADGSKKKKMNSVQHYFRKHRQFSLTPLLTRLFSVHEGQYHWSSSSCDGVPVPWGRHPSWKTRGHPSQQVRLPGIPQALEAVETRKGRDRRRHGTGSEF